MKIMHLIVTVVVAVKIVIVKKYGGFVILFVHEHWTSLRNAISYWEKKPRKKLLFLETHQNVE